MYNNQYAVEVTLKDAKQTQIGYLARTDLNPSVSVGSQLPLTMEISRWLDLNSLGEGHITFAYGADSWASVDTSRCSVGSTAMAPGALVNDMDCGFAC